MFDCIGVIVNVSPCILLFLHLQMVGRTDGNPNLINYNRNILDPGWLDNQSRNIPLLDRLHLDYKISSSVEMLFLHIYFLFFSE